MPTPPAPGATSPTVAFRASWSRSTHLLTVLFLSCCIAILAFSYSGPRPSPVFLLTVAGLTVAIALAFGFAPTGYRIDDSSVAIDRRMGVKRLPLDSVRGARLMEPAELAESTWRWPAVGGLFGFFGPFETPALGLHRWYASRDENLILLQTSDGPIVLSPDDPATFVREVNQRLRAGSRI